MIDIHTHILYNIDDGSGNIKESIDLVQTEIDNNVDKIVFTPHFNPYSDSLDSYIETRAERYKNLCEYFSDKNIEMYIGSEVFYSQLIYYYSTLKEFCFSNKKYILMEFPAMQKFDNEFFKLFYRLIEKFDIIPIIAHIEYYNYIKKHYKVLYRFIELNCVIQVNADNFINNIKNRFYEKIFNNQLVDIIASDCHNMIKRPPRLKEAMDLVKIVYGSDYYEKIIETQNKIIKLL